MVAFCPVTSTELLLVDRVSSKCSVVSTVMSSIIITVTHDLDAFGCSVTSPPSRTKSSPAVEYFKKATFHMRIRFSKMYKTKAVRQLLATIAFFGGTRCTKDTENIVVTDQTQGHGGGSISNSKSWSRIKNYQTSHSGK